MWITGKKVAAYDLTRFADYVKPRGTGFFQIVKILIAVSILFTIFMLTVK